jgi:hypothetical protein
MRNRTAIEPIFLSLALATMTACSGVSGRMQENSGPTSVQLSNPSTKGNRELKSPIRQVDFRNFSYPKLPTGKCSMDEVHLTNGKYEAPETIPRKIPSIDCWSVTLGTIDYGDTTGDGIEEAIVTLYAERGGTESSQDVYIYSPRDEAPILLWKFATGDRADGGRRRIFAENGALVVELFGVGTVIGKELYGTEDVPDCCPEHYTRTKYKWQENRFQQDGPEEVLPNPSRDAIPISPSPSPTS